MNKSDFPRVYYRMPHEKEIWCVQSHSNTVELDSMSNVPNNPGFILYPFSLDGSSKPLYINADEHFIVSSEVLQTENNWKVRTSEIISYAYLTKVQYCKNIEEALKGINSGELQKVVLSRQERINDVSLENTADIFLKLCEKYPTTFVSLVYIPNNILWITATPELLISANGNEIKTISLAGTKSSDNNETWGSKEKMEQQIVTEYIHEVLKSYSENINVSDPHEFKAGNVKHLVTSFSASLKSNLWELVSALHPTPAVCGMPMEKAKQFIENTEGYDRKYYAGFLGPRNINGETNLFVNIRCAEILANAINLYIGGGITKDSIPEKEWEETELKSKTLLFAFEEA